MAFFILTCILIIIISLIVVNIKTIFLTIMDTIAGFFIWCWDGVMDRDTYYKDSDIVTYRDYNLQPNTYNDTCTSSDIGIPISEDSSCKKSNPAIKHESIYFDDYITPFDKNLLLDEPASKQNSEGETDYTKIIIDFFASKKYVIKHERLVISNSLSSYFFTGDYITEPKIKTLMKELAYNIGKSNVRFSHTDDIERGFKIEIGKSVKSTLKLADTVNTEKNDMALQVPIGLDTENNIYNIDLHKAPHILVAGATGSGKSVCLHTIISSLIYRYSPNDLKLMLIDMKKVELSIFKNTPHLLMQPTDSLLDIQNSFYWLEDEMKSRFSKMACEGVNDIVKYNKKQDRKKLPYIVVVIDELHTLFSNNARTPIDEVTNILAKGRAAGIHLILCTQRPSVDTIIGIAKANLTMRITFKVSSITDSNIALGERGAERLTDNGDCYISGDNEKERVQVSFTNELDINLIKDYILTQGHIFKADSDLKHYIYNSRGA